MHGKTLRTGELAEKAGVNVETLRYYERRGILKRPGTGHRRYPPEAVRVVRFVKRAQQLGFALAEVEGLLDLRQDEARGCGTRCCTELTSAATAKIEEIDRKIRSLQAVKDALAVLVASCARTPAAPECPLLEALDNEDRNGL